MKKVKDPVSGYTHLLGFIISIIGLVFLIIFSAKYGEGAWDVVSFTIFGTGLILLYLFSTLYHLLNVGQKATRIFRKFDHIMIYILIASSYTPICLGPLRGGWGWSIFGIVWRNSNTRNNTNMCVVRSSKMANNHFIPFDGLGSYCCNISHTQSFFRI